MGKLTKRISPIKWLSAPSLNFQQGQSGQIKVRDYVHDPQRLLPTITMNGTLPSGCSFNGEDVSYDGVGVAASSSVTFTATTGTWSQTSSSTTCAIQASQQNNPPVWATIPPQTVATGYVGPVLDLANYCTDPDGDPITYGASGLPTGLSLQGSVVQADGTQVAAPATTITVTADDGQTTNDAEADWITRSTGAGVVWAHDFRDPNEVKAWRASSDNALESTTPDNWQDVQRSSSSGIGSSGMLVHAIYGTTLSQPIDGASTTLYLNSVSDFPDPAVVGNSYWALLGLAGNLAEAVLVTAKDAGSNSLTITRGGNAQPHSAGDPFSMNRKNSWTRAMGAFSTESGKTVADIGIANGFKNRDSDWIASARSQYRMRGAWWGHQSYSDLYDALWPVNGYDSYSTNQGRSYTDTFDGSEFWIQWRMRVTGLRFENPAGKFCYLQTLSGSTRQQWFLNVIPEFSDPTRLRFVHDGQGTNAELMPMDGGDTYKLKLDAWVTYMIHIIPGRYDVPESTVELFVAEPGDTTWRQLASTSTFAMKYTLPAVNEGNPQAWNSFSVLNYPNHYQGSSSSGASRSNHTVEATQIILSRDPIACPTVGA